MWTEHKLTMTFQTPLCGGAPRFGKIVDDWVRMRAATHARLRNMKENPPGPDGKAPQTLDEVATERQATLDALPEEIEEATQKVWVGFSKDDRGLFVRGGNIRAHLKDCANVVGRILRKESNELAGQVKQFAAKLKDALYVAEDHVYVLNGDGKPYTEATAYREATMHVMTAQGPRTCLKRVDYCEPARLQATLQLLDGTEVNLRHVELCLEYGAIHGFGQDRSLQYGRYTWTLD